MSLFNLTDGARSQRWWLLPLAVVLFFLIGLWLFFPASAVQQRLQLELSRQLRQSVEVGPLDWQLPATVAIEQIETASPLGPALNLSQLRLKPVWHRLFSSSPAVALQGQILNGHFALEFDRNQQLQLTAGDLQLDLPLPQWPTVRASASLRSLTGHGNTRFPGQLDQLELQLDDLQLAGLQQVGLAMDRFNLGSVLLRASQQKQRLTIDQLASRNGDLIINGSGFIQLDRRLERSKLNLTLTLSPAPQADPALGQLLSLLTKPDTNGRYPLRLIGTLEQPRLR